MQQSATSAQDMDQIHPEPRKDDVDVEKQEQSLRFEDDEEQEEQEEQDDHEEHDPGHGANHPRLNTSMDEHKKPHHFTPNTPGKQSVFHGAHVKDIDPAAHRLARSTKPLTPEVFFQLMGLKEPTPEHEDMEDLMIPHGLYTRMVKAVRWTNKKYYAFAIAVYVFLVLQLMISAVFIILGSLRNVDTHITIAVRIPWISYPLKSAERHHDGCNWLG